MAIVHGKKDTFHDLISNDLVLVDFFATWCGPCKMLGPVLEDLDSDRANVKIVKVDIDESRDLAREYGVMSVPTLLLFKNGTLVSQKVGFMPKEMLIEWINEAR